VFIAIDVAALVTQKREAALRASSLLWVLICPDIKSRSLSFYYETNFVNYRDECTANHKISCNKSNLKNLIKAGDSIVVSSALM